MKPFAYKRSWGLSVILASIVATSVVHAADDQTEAANDDAPSAWTQVVDPNSELGRTATDKLGTEDQLNERLLAILNKPVEVIAADGRKQMASFWQSQMAKLKIGVEIGAGFDLLAAFRAQAHFKRNVEPTNIAGQQQVADTYEFELGTKQPVNVATKVRITFVRRFSGPNAKHDALFARIYGINRVPRDSQEIKDKLSPGQMVRVEFEGDLGLAKGFSTTANKLKKEAGLTIGGEGLFMADIYRKSQTEVETRFLGMKNKGSIEGNLGIRKYKGALLGRMWPGVVGEFLSAGVGLDGMISNPFSKDPTIDTMMVVYRFNLNLPGSVDALDEIFANIKKMGFIRLMNPAGQDKDLAQDLLQQASLAEQYALADANKSPDKQRVVHLFRGRMTSTMASFGPHGNASIFLSGSMKRTSSLTFVRKYGNDNQLQYYWMESDHSVNESQIGASVLYSYKRTHDMDLLVGSDQNQKPGQFLELDSRTEWQDNKFSLSNLSDLKRATQMTIPAGLSQNSAVDSFFPTETQHSGTYSLVTVLGPKALAALQGHSQNEIAQALYTFLDRHPENYLMHVPSSNVDSSNQSLAEYSESMASDLQKVLNSTSDKERTEVFHRLRRNIVFSEWITSQFLPSLLPQQGVEDMVGVKLRLSSDELGQVKDMSLGKVQSSEVFNAVKFMRRILEEERGLDMHLDEISNSELTQ